MPILTALGTSKISVDRQMWAEDVQDVLADASPDETPLFTVMPKGRARAILEEWPAKRLNAISTNVVTATTGVVSLGEDSPDFSRTRVSRPARTMLNSAVMNFSQDVEVSDRLVAINPFGVDDEFSMQIYDGIREVAKEIEYWMLIDTFTASNQGNADAVRGTTTEPTRFKPLVEQLFQGRAAAKLNFLPNVIAVNPLGSRLDNAGATETEIWNGAPAITQGILWEGPLMKALEIGRGTMDQGGCRFDLCVLPTANFGQVPKVFNMGGALMSGFTPAGSPLTMPRMMTADMNMERVKNVVKVVDTQFGAVAFMEDRWLRQANNTAGVATAGRRADPTISVANDIGLGWFFEQRFLEWRWLIPLYFERLGRRGRSHQAIISGDGTPILEHPLAGLLMVGLNNVGLA